MKLRQRKQHYQYYRSHYAEESGQVLVEYAIMLSMVVMIALMIRFLSNALMDYGWRIIELIAWEP